MKIAKRSSRNEHFDNLVSLKIGMCLTARIDEDMNVINNNHGHSLPYPHFVYIVSKITNDTITLIDTSHNNKWTIKEEGLIDCELVCEDVHSNCNQVDCEFINRVLLDS